MCLAPRTSLQDGWAGVADLGVWLDQATHWFERYASEGWAMQPQQWLMCAPLLPGPDYRPTLLPTMLIAVPPQWYGRNLAPFGAFRARLPREQRGMGAVTSWQVGRSKVHRWDAGEALVAGEYDEIVGAWTLASHAAGKAPVPPREAERALRRAMKNAAGRHSPLLCATAIDMSAAAGDRAWAFSRDPLSAILSLVQQSEPAISMLEWLSKQKELIARMGPWPGIRLDRARLEPRRVAGKGTEMLDRIAAAHVMLVGLGALGSEVAHLLAREGVARFTLIDGDLLMPENVTRHRADLTEAGQPKVETMKRHILRVNPTAKVETVSGWIDELVPAEGWRSSRPSLMLGLTGDEGSEHVLGARCAELGIGCLHAWLELDGLVLRLFRALPERDPTLLDLTRSPESSIPYLPRRATPGPAACAENVLPGSAANVHAAANFVARAALDLIAGRAGEDNHWLFAPDGVSDPDPGVPAALRARYGTASFALSRQGA